jgi:predicted permease
MDAAFALILASLALGWALSALGVIASGSADAFNRFVIYVCLPAVVVRLVPKLAWQPGLAILAVTPWVLVAVGMGLVTGLARLFSWRRDVLAALLLCVPLGNTSFLGFPLVGALLGPGAVRYAVLYDQLGSFLILSTYGLLVVARFSGDGQPTIRSTLTRVVQFPPFIALCLGLLPFSHPALLDAVLERLGDTLVPVAMFAVGLKLSFRPPKEKLALVVGLGAKMVLAPLVAVAVARVLGASGLAARVAVLESGMPPMITAGALATLAGFAPELAAALVGYGVLLSLVTLPVIARLLQ